MTCVTIVNPALRLDGADGFLWKPISESDGKLVVLFPSTSSGTYCSLTGSGGELIESGVYIGKTNGDRPTFRFSLPGAAYPSNVTVCISGSADLTPGEPSDTDTHLEVSIEYSEDPSVDFSFGEENGDLRVLPPLPLRVNNKTFYESEDQQYKDDIKKISNIFGIKPDILIDLVMESEEIVGNEDLIDHVFINFGTRIHDNSKASCKYIYKFLTQVLEYANEYGGFIGSARICGTEEFTDVDGRLIDAGEYIGANETFHPISNCNTFTVRAEQYFSEFTFSTIEVEVKSIAEILSDPVMAEQYEERSKLSGALWYISSSPGDLSKEDDYVQPEEENTSVPFLSFGECNGENVTLITVFSPGGTVVITDAGSGATRTRVLNPANPNSVLIPYIPSIGELLTNNELADNFLTSLHVSIYVANFEIVKVPWWLRVLNIVMFVVTVVLMVYSALTMVAWKFVAMLVVGFLAGLAIAEITKNWGVIAGIIATAVVVIASRGTGDGQSLTGMFATIANMKLPQILLTILDIVIKSVSIVQQDGMSQLTDETSGLEESTQYYRDEITEMDRAEAEANERDGGFVGIEPLLDPLLSTSIRTVVNPMDPSAYFDMYDSFHQIGFELQDYDRMFEDPFDFDSMLSTG